MEDYKKIIFKEKGCDDLKIGFFYTYQGNYIGSYSINPHEGLRYFKFGLLDDCEFYNEIDAEKFSDLDIEWYIYIEDILPKIIEEENFINKIASICSKGIANVCLNSKEEFQSILSLIEDKKKIKFCDKCKNRNKCNSSEKWECLGSYPPKYYKEGTPEYEPPYGNRTEKQLLSFIARTGRLPKTEKQLREEKLHHR